MAKLKTKPTKVSAESHIDAIAKEEQRDDARTLVALMRSIKRLANIDLKVLETLVARSVADTKRRYPEPR